MKTQYNIKKSLFNDYDTVLFDLDLTILECFDPKGTSIPALKLVPPLSLVEEDLIKDSMGNIARLQANVRDVLENLDEWGMNLGVVSASAVPDMVDEAQPAIMVLKKLDIYQFFNYIVVVKPKINKGDYARPEGKTLFIDDDQNQLQAVNIRGLVDVLSRRSFVNWNDLFSEAKPSKPKPTSLQTAVNAPQPTTSSWISRLRQVFSFKRQADPLTYTDKSDIDGGIGGSAKNMAEMWHMEDHFTVDNGRDHVWGEPWEPMRQFFLDEKVTPTLEDKIKQQHPDKGGIAVSTLKFAVDDESQVNPVQDEQMRSVIQEIVNYVVSDYVRHDELDIRAAVDICLPDVKQYLMEDYSLSEEEVVRYEPIMKAEIIQAATDAAQRFSEDREALSSGIRDFLLKKFNHEQFSLEALIRIVRGYIRDTSNFPTNTVAKVVAGLPTQFPSEFTQNGNLIYIGDLKQKPVAEKVHLDTDELKDVALKPIEDFAQYGDEVKKTPDGIYIFKDNGSDVLAVAHLDTVQDLSHFEVQNLDDTRVIRNAQLDDRLGAYIILKLLPKLGVNADILLTEGEEKGRSTARYFEARKQYKWIFSFDRMGMDTVMYQYHDQATEELLNNNDFTVGQGSFSDIAFLEHLGVKGFNFGVGYYDNHGKESNAIESHVLHNVRLFKNFYDKYKNTELPHTDTGYLKHRFGRLTFGDVIGLPEPEIEDDGFLLGDTVDVVPLPADNFNDFRGTIVEVPSLRRTHKEFFAIEDQDGDVWDVEAQQIHKVAAEGSPNAEQYPDYEGVMDVSPLDPKSRDEKERPDSVRKDLEKMYYGRGTHDTVMRPETDRPITPFASLSFEQPIKPQLHKPNKIMVHEAVADALTFAEVAKARYVSNHEVRDDYKYTPQVKTAEYRNTNDARAHGLYMTTNEALVVLDKWYDTVTSIPTAMDITQKMIILQDNQFNREAVEARLGFPPRQSIGGANDFEKYQKMKQRLLDIISGRTPDPLSKEVV